MPNSTPAVMEQQPRPMVVFRLGGKRYAFDLQDVSEVVRAAQTTRLPGAEPADLGYLAIRGTTIRALKLHAVFGLDPRPVSVSDRFVILGSPPSLAALVDSVDGIAEVTPVVDSLALEAPDTDAGAALIRPGRLGDAAGDLLGIVDAAWLGRSLRQAA